MIESNTEYDAKIFRYSTMQDPHYTTKTANNKNESAFGENKVPIKPVTHAYPCKLDTAKKQWEIMQQKRFGRRIPSQTAVDRHSRNVQGIRP